MAEFSFDYVNYVLNDIYIRFPHFILPITALFGGLIGLAVGGTMKEIKIAEPVINGLKSEEMTLEKAIDIEEIFRDGGSIIAANRIKKFIRKNFPNEYRQFYKPRANLT